MRVIAGSARGTTLNCPRGLSTRPATDRLRMSLFSMLEGTIEGSRVLDLYAGSGSLGIEALSRGAASCTFVEASPQAVAALEKNLERTRFCARARVIRADAREALLRLKARGKFFDMVFVDPPFSSTKDGIEALGAVRAACAQGAVVFLRAEAGSCELDPPRGLRLFTEKRWGRSLGFLMIREDGEDQR